MAIATIPKPATKPAPASQPVAPNAKGSNNAVIQKTTVPKGTGASVQKPAAPVAAPPAVETTLDAPATDALTLGFYNDEQVPLPQGTIRLRPLNKAQEEELRDCETTIRENLPKFLAVGQALARIQAKKLWRLYCKSWEEYLETRLGITRAYASMQTSAARAMENLLTIGEQTTPPSTERQLRPLAKLSPEEQRRAWELASTKAGGGKVSGKNVEDAVSELLAGGTPSPGWLDATRQKLVDAGYITDFTQPVELGENTWVDLRKADTEVYVKLIDRPTLGSLGVCYAMRERQLTCQVVLNGQALGKRSLKKDSNGALTGLLDPVLSVFVHSLGGYVEYNGHLYEGAGLGDDFKLTFAPSTSDETSDLRAALEAQEQANETSVA